jgi:hypothetical protein
MPAPTALEKSTAPQPEPPIGIAKLPENDSDSVKPTQSVISEILLESMVTVPEKDSASRRLEYNTSLRSRYAKAPEISAWHYRKTTDGDIVGFEFSNHGGNRILPPLSNVAKDQMFTRDFQFRFDERARQDIHLTITDWAASRDQKFRLSELMNSIMYFFPRSFLPAIVDVGNIHLVTLPTGEEVKFNAETHEIVGGALSESAVDLNPNRNARRFPGIRYNGKGVVVRVNSRGSDPRFSATATVITRSPSATCKNGIRCSRCQVPARELWDQKGALRFKFPTDREFDRYLRARCQFGLPKNETGYALTIPKQ